MPKDKKNTVDLIIGLPVYNEIQAIESVSYKHLTLTTIYSV